jgi:hypothetical protein
MEITLSKITNIVRLRYTLSASHLTEQQRNHNRVRLDIFFILIANHNSLKN